MKTSKIHTLALSEALLVTFLWSTSYVFIKIGLKEINPLVFAAYRYTIASAVLMLPVFYRYRRHSLNLSLRQVLLFFLIGFYRLFYSSRTGNHYSS
ncbi:MAG: hypothetical protein DRJ47_02965 [Thermoprotei archaeon]|nr:MAG: hypothetical protein DRJ47_02965 [Thermoprotei archaeon]